VHDFSIRTLPAHEELQSFARQGKIAVGIGWQRPTTNVSRPKNHPYPGRADAPEEYQPATKPVSPFKRTRD